MSFEFYVRDRQPSVRFTGNAYVLPRTGQNGIPLVSVNSKEAKIQLFRIGDAVASRNIHAAVYDALRLVKDL